MSSTGVTVFGVDIPRDRLFLAVIGVALAVVSAGFIDAANVKTAQAGLA
jgi:hypothetical protein